MASLANIYRCIDDTGTSAGPTGGQTGGGSGQPLCPDFTALTLANAGQVAYLLSSILQRPVRLMALNSPLPTTLVVGVAATTALTSVPSGIAF
jgi:hypothetical protein